MCSTCTENALYYNSQCFDFCCCCSDTKSSLTPCDSMDCSTPGFFVFHCLPEFAQIHVHEISDAIEPSHALSSPSPAFNLFQHQGLFQSPLLHQSRPTGLPEDAMSSFSQFSSVTQSCLTLCNPMDCSRPDFPVHHQLLELAQTHAHQVSDTIQPSHPLSSPSPAFNLFQHQDLFQ